MNRWKRFNPLAAAGLLTLAFCLGLTAGVAAQNISSISGEVLDLEGKPFEGLVVKFKSDRGQTFETKTDANGRFMQTGLSSGKWTIEIFHEGQRIWEGIVERLGTGEERKLNPINFKQMAEADPKFAAERKKREEEKSKFEEMKTYFDNGRAAFDQSKQIERGIASAAPDQRDSMRQQVAQLQQTAISEFQKAEQAAGEKEPNLHLVLANLGAAYEAAGNYEQAAASFQRAIAVKPDQANYNVGLANSLSRLGRVDEASAACDKIGALDPANAATCFRNIGIVLYNVSKLKEAVTPLRKATELDPKHADAWYLLGASLLASMESRQVGDKLEFIVQPGTAEAYTTYLELAPNGRFAGEAKAALQSLESLGHGVATKVKAGKKKS